MVSALDVAAYIINKAAPMSAMKLQKLVYYCQAWHLAWHDEPMFAEEIQAWANGPVVYELFKVHRGRYTLTSDFVIPDANAAVIEADRRRKQTADKIVESYNLLTPNQLSALTHAERPWQEARSGFAPTDRCNVAISVDTMLDFYGGLASDKRAVEVASLAN